MWALKEKVELMWKDEYGPFLNDCFGDKGIPHYSII
jgi:hypothetical protein